MTPSDAHPPMPARPFVEVYIATSMDGFIARPDGSLDWLMQAQARAPAGEDFGYADFFATIDALVMGRRTYETVLGFDPWPYGDRPVYVMTQQPALPVPAALHSRVQRRQETPAALMAALGAGGVGRVYLDGGALVQAFLRDGLIDRLTITTVPVLIGAGRRLFGPLAADSAWRVESSRHWPECGFVQTRWCRA